MSERFDEPQSSVSTSVKQSAEYRKVCKLAVLSLELRRRSQNGITCTPTGAR